MPTKPVLLGWVGLGLTFLKPLEAILIIALIVFESNFSASILILLLMIIDLFDGMIFERSTPQMVEKYGWLRRKADAIGDRLSIWSVFLTLIFLASMPFFVYGLVLVREVILMGVTYYGYKKTGRWLPKVNDWSRATSFLVGLLAIAWLSAWIGAVGFLWTLVFFVGIVSLVVHYRQVMGLGPIMA